MSARQFDSTCDEIEQFDFVKFNATAPHAVNAALTCELYFKALYLIATGKEIKGHDLHSLYKKQPMNIQTGIFNEYYHLHQNRPVPKRFVGQMTNQIFLNELQEIKDVFVDWRYIYEVPNASIRLGILRFLRLSLRKVTSTQYDGLHF